MKRLFCLLGSLAAVAFAGCNQTATFQGILTQASTEQIVVGSFDGNSSKTFTNNKIEAEYINTLKAGEAVEVEYRTNGKTDKAYTITTIDDKAAQEKMIGSWVELNPPVEGLIQGIDLKADCQAQSIGMATLLYKTWCVLDGNLIVTGTSVGNGQSIDFTEQMPIKSVNDTLMVVCSRNREVEYIRQQSTKME